MNPYRVLLSANYVDSQSGPVSSLVQAVLQLGEVLADEQEYTTTNNPVVAVREHLTTLGINPLAVAQVQSALSHIEQQYARGQR